jgi:glycosyltransferase involved in cell wall biosynthesis
VAFHCETIFEIPSVNETLLDSGQAVMGPRGSGGRPVVWFVNQYVGSPVHGMEFRHYQIGREITRLGWNVVIVSGSYSHLFTRLPEVTGEFTLEVIDGLTYCWVRVPQYGRAASVGRVINMTAFMLRLFRLPAARLPLPDAIVVSSPSLFPIVPMARWAARFRARLVFEVRDLWPLTLQELGGFPNLHPLVVVMAWFERRAYRVADAVVSVLPAAEPHLIAKGMAPGKVLVIPNGVSAGAFVKASSPPPANVLAAIGGSPFTVGFVGTLGTANALETLIAAAGEVADEGIRIIIVGQGPEEPRLRALATDVPNIVFAGPVVKPDVPATLRAFDVCYVGYHSSPLYRFGISPNKVFDYMAAGRPVILAASAANDPVRDAGCGVTVPPDDPAALAGAIRSLRLLPSNELSRLGANGRAYAEKTHAYPILARSYLGALAPITRGASPDPSPSEGPPRTNR